MTTKARRIESLQESIYSYYRLEQEAKRQGSIAKWKYWTLRWALMLYREYLRDNVKVRAESLAYLMTFSILPIIAGCFFIFTIFTQFGMVQEAIGGFVNSFLDTIPSEHREVIQDYVIRFKDAYLSAISGKSGRLGIFALAILFWVGLQTFNNIDRALNDIWQSERDRPLLEKIRNFLVVAVGAPIVLMSSLSVPLILRGIPATRLLLEMVPLLSSLLNIVLPVFIVLGTFTLLYRFVPVTQVRWKCAAIGGVFAAVLLQLSNMGMNVYFRFGTNSAYGKAAIVPLIGFWIYLIWIIIILGAEVSYLCQNEKYYVAQRKTSPTLFDAEALLGVVARLMKSFRNGEGPLCFDDLYKYTALNAEHLRRILHYLEDRKWLLKTLPQEKLEEPAYSLARDVSQERIADLLQDFLIEDSAHVPDPAISQPFQASLKQWMNAFGSNPLASLLEVKAAPKK